MLLDLNTTGLDEAIAALEHLRQGGVERAVARALGGAGGSANATAWVVVCQRAAETALNSLVGNDPKRAFVPGFVQHITHAWVGAERAMAITLAPPASLLAAASALSESLHTRSYGSAESGVQRVRQQPLEASDEQANWLDQVRDAIREWVVHEKVLTEADADTDFDPDAITDRIMAVMGLGNRSDWRRLLASPELQAAGQRLAARIETWLAGVAAADGWTPSSAVTERPTRIDGGVQDFLASSLQAGSLAAGGLSQAELQQWTDTILQAWVKAVNDNLPRAVMAELRAATQIKQGGLFDD